MFAATRTNMDAAIAAWVAAGDVDAWLEIRGGIATQLPPLPPTLRRLACINCQTLQHLGTLPTGLAHLICYDCIKLRRLLPLPVGMDTLYITGCRRLTVLPRLPATLVCLWGPSNAALRALPPLPAALKRLSVHGCTALRTSLLLPPMGLEILHCDKSRVVLTDAKPRLLECDMSADAWRVRVRCQHAEDRARCGPHAPSAALLYV